MLDQSIFIWIFLLFFHQKSLFFFFNNFYDNKMMIEHGILGIQICTIEFFFFACCFSMFCENLPRFTLNDIIRNFILEARQFLAYPPSIYPWTETYSRGLGYIKSI